MSEDLHARAQALFEAACDLQPDEQRALLERECAEDDELRALVRSLLELDREPEALQTPAAAALTPAWERFEAESALPERIGRYRVVRRLGAGGMGIVYEAEQDQPRRRVALKLLRAELVSAEMLRRFEVEAQVLGRLAHPGIARIFEAGTAELGHGPQPFFAMELIEGEPLVDFAERRELGVRARLELVAEVCRAVQHAHQKGVIHRDLKPSNILVDSEGRPHVLDFGVARAADADLSLATSMTRTGELVGTLPYMSPEQLGGDPAALDTRCDVYALGVLTYELLAGARPFDLGRKALAEAARIITEDEPTRLGALRRELAGDLETIVGKALEKDKERRYASAEELATDLKRHLRHEPILARPPSASYQVVQFARRNRVLVAGAVATVLSLVAGLVASTWLWQREQAAREQAQETITSLEEMQATFGRLLRSPNPMEGPSDVRMVDVLEHAADELDGAFADRPIVRSWLLQNLGATFDGLGLRRRAVELLEEAHALRVEAGAPPRLLAGTKRLLADSLERVGRGKEALELLEQARALYAAAGGPVGDELAQCAFLEGRALLNAGRGEEARPLFEQALAYLEQGHRNVDRRAAAMRNALARAHVQADRYEEALASAERALEHLGPDGDTDAAMERLQIYNTISSVHFFSDDLAESARWGERALELMRELAGDDHVDVAVLTYNLGRIAERLGDLEGAVQRYEEVRLLREGAGAGAGDVLLGDAHEALADVHLERGDQQAAERSAALAVEVLRPTGGERLAASLCVRGRVLTGLDRRAEAREAYREALERLPDREGVEHVSDDFLPVRIAIGLAILDRLDGSWEACLERALEAQAMAEAVVRDNRELVLVARSEVALALVELERADEARELAEASLVEASEERYAHRPLAARARADLAWARWSVGEREPGERALRAALAQLEAHPAAGTELPALYRGLLRRVEAAPR